MAYYRFELITGDEESFVRCLNAGGATHVSATPWSVVYTWRAPEAAPPLISEVRNEIFERLAAASEKAFINPKKKSHYAAHASDAMLIRRTPAFREDLQAVGPELQLALTEDEVFALWDAAEAGYFPMAVAKELMEAEPKERDLRDPSEQGSGAPVMGFELEDYLSSALIHAAEHDWFLRGADKKLADGLRRYLQVHA